MGVPARASAPATQCRTSFCIVADPKERTLTGEFGFKLRLQTLLRLDGDEQNSQNVKGAASASVSAEVSGRGDDESVWLVVRCGRFCSVMWSSVTVSGVHVTPVAVREVGDAGQPLETAVVAAPPGETPTHAHGSGHATGTAGAYHPGTFAILLGTRAALSAKKSRNINVIGSFKYCRGHRGDGGEDGALAGDWRRWWMVSSGLEREDERCFPEPFKIERVKGATPHPQNPQNEAARAPIASPSGNDGNVFVLDHRRHKPVSIRCKYSISVETDASCFVIASGVLQNHHLSVRDATKNFQYEVPVECEANEFGIAIAPAIAQPSAAYPYLTLFAPMSAFAADEGTTVESLKMAGDILGRAVRNVEEYVGRKLPTLALHVCYVPPELAPRKCWAATGLIFVDSSCIFGPAAAASRAITESERIFRALASQWFGLGCMRVLDAVKDPWLLCGLREHVVAHLIAEEFGRDEKEWRCWQMERRLIREVFKPSSRGKGKWLPNLSLVSGELDRYRKTSHVDSLWLTRAAVVVELLSRHVTPSSPDENCLRKVIRVLFAAGKYPTVGVVALFESLVEDGLISADMSTLFKQRWVYSNVLPQFDVGTLYDANKGFLHIAFRQEGLGFVRGKKEDAAGGCFMLYIHVRTQKEVQRHQIILRRSRMVCEEKFIYIKKPNKKKGQPKLTQEEYRKALMRTPITFMRADPEGEWLALVDFRQPEHFLTAALGTNGEKGVRGRLDALDSIEKFFARLKRERKKLDAGVGDRAIRAVKTVLGDSSIPPRVRQHAAHVLSCAFTRENEGAGLGELLRFFRGARFKAEGEHGGAALVTANDFSCQAEYEVMCATVRSMTRSVLTLRATLALTHGKDDGAATDAGAADGQGLPGSGGDSGILHLLEDCARAIFDSLYCNDNRHNAYDDTEWITLLVESCGTLFNAYPAEWLPKECVARAVSAIDALMAPDARGAQGGSHVRVYAPLRAAQSSACARALMNLALRRHQMIPQLDLMFRSWEGALPTPVQRLPVLAAHAELLACKAVCESVSSFEDVLVKVLLPLVSLYQDADGVCTRVLAATKSILDVVKPRLAKQYPLAKLCAFLGAHTTPAMQSSASQEPSLLRGDALMALRALLRRATTGKEPPVLAKEIQSLDTSLEDTVGDPGSAKAFSPAVKIVGGKAGDGTAAAGASTQAKKVKLLFTGMTPTGGKDAKQTTEKKKNTAQQAPNGGGDVGAASTSATTTRTHETEEAKKAAGEPKTKLVLKIGKKKPEVGNDASVDGEAGVGPKPASADAHGPNPRPEKPTGTTAATDAHPVSDQAAGATPTADRTHPPPLDSAKRKRALVEGELEDARDPSPPKKKLTFKMKLQPPSAR